MRKGCCNQHKLAIYININPMKNKENKEELSDEEMLKQIRS